MLSAFLCCDQCDVNCAQGLRGRICCMRDHGWPTLRLVAEGAEALVCLRLLKEQLGVAALQNPALDVFTAKPAPLRFNNRTPGMMKHGVVSKHQE
jgi:hypothetical protein